MNRCLALTGRSPGISKVSCPYALMCLALTGRSPGISKVSCPYVLMP
ncbi:hypothetical protein Poly21_35140 [Allorhodopirellula heiligendammensis]|uniref:Uncharacterized protein n=1 Tax=Allorhodopirellula heiligendammensis TaxID=2714739 RepID=A0A5C6C0A3_9BACT|nr:hypothetical protein Poly21_35140 [Allorhodopirellula heiligendammensis]